MKIIGEPDCMLERSMIVHLNTSIGGRVGLLWWCRNEKRWTSKHNTSGLAFDRISNKNNNDYSIVKRSVVRESQGISLRLLNNWVTEDNIYYKVIDTNLFSME